MRLESIKNNSMAVLTILTLCLILCVLVGCNKGKKKSEHAPGEEWIADMRDRIEASIVDSAKKSQMLRCVDQMRTDLMNLDQLIQKKW